MIFFSAKKKKKFHQKNLKVFQKGGTDVEVKQPFDRL